MERFRNIQSVFDAAARERGETPLSDVPTVRETPRAQRASRRRPKSPNAKPSTLQRPRLSTKAKSPVSGTECEQIPKPTPKPAETEPLPKPGDGEILIAVMGATGSGKSHFCRAATGDDNIEVGDGLESCTQKPTTHHLMLPTGSRETRVTLVDTPGFNDSMRNDAEILTEIAVELCETYKQNRKFSGIIYFHCIINIRMERSAVAQLGLFRELCGDDSGMLQNVILATNRWDCLQSEEVGIRRQSDLENSPRYWKPMCLKGSQVMRFEGTNESALELIRLILHRTPLPLKIQQEMVDENKPLAETGAGRFVEAEIDKLRKDHEQTLVEIKKEMERALQKKDEDMQMLLTKQSERWGKKIDELRKQQKMMKADNEKVLTLLREEQKQRKEERERIENEVDILKVDIDARAREEETKLERMDKQLELATQVSKLQLEKEKPKTDNKQTRQKARNPREDIETWSPPRSENKPAIEQETDQRQKQPEQQPVVQREELELRQRDEQDLEDAGYGALDGQNSATIWLSDAVQKHEGLSIIRLLLARGANPASCIPQPRGQKRSALHVAAEVGYADAVGIFVEGSTAALDIADDNGNTALVTAAMGGHGAVVDMLLARGAKPDTRYKFGYTPLICAATHGYEPVVRLLLAKRAKLDITNGDGYTALMCASSRGHEAVVHLLLKSGPKLDIVARCGYTALSFAAGYGREAIVRLLLNSGAKLDIVDCDHGPLMCAPRNGHEAIVRLLLTSGAKLDRG